MIQRLSGFRSFATLVRLYLEGIPATAESAGAKLSEVIPTLRRSDEAEKLAESVLSFPRDRLAPATLLNLLSAASWVVSAKTVIAMNIKERERELAVMHGLVLEG